MNKNRSHLIFSIMILCLLVLSASPAFSVKPSAGNKPQFEYIGYPNNVNKDGEDVKIIFCFINRGDIGYFDTADNILVSIPVGGAANDLAGINTYTCEHMGSDWAWTDVSTSPNEIALMFQPTGPITVNEGDIICFDIYLTINGTEGLAFATITENLEGTTKPLNTEIGILKTEIPLTSEVDPTITDESIKDGVDWTEVSSRPTGLDDGDDVGITTETDPTVNALAKATLSCSDGQVAKWNNTTSTWECAADIDTDTDTQLTEAEVDSYVANNGYLTSYTETDPTITDSSIKDGVSWTEVSNRPAGLDDGDDVGITTETDPTVNALGKATLSCSDGQVVKWNDTTSAWECAADIDTDTDTQLTEAEVDSYVGNNGYLTSYTESDPTITDSSIKDGVSWTEVSNRPAGLDDGDDVGITTESDPTVAANVKDGVDWTEVSGIPAGFADGVDNTGSDLWNQSGADIYYDAGNVGIGKTEPSATLDVAGNAKFAGGVDASRFSGACIRSGSVETYGEWVPIPELDGLSGLLILRGTCARAVYAYSWWQCYESPGVPLNLLSYNDWLSRGPRARITGCGQSLEVRLAVHPYYPKSKVSWLYIGI